jgi:hypothetical protein
MAKDDLTEREQALIARRDELGKIALAGKDAEAQLRTIDAEIDKAHEPQPDPHTVETLRVIEQHRLNDVDADAFKRGREMAQFPALVAQQRDRDVRAKRAAIDESIADNGERDADL